MVTAYFFSTPLIDYGELIKEQSMCETPMNYFVNRYSNHRRK